MKLQGNTFLITGGGSGIGEALAHRFHDLGNTVIIVGRQFNGLQKAAVGRANIIPITLDVMDAQAIEEFARRVIVEHPGLNVLVNNAGITRFEEVDRSHDLTDMEETITTNVLGPIRLTNALMDHLVGQPNSAIVNITSGLAFVPLVEAPTYGASKAALHSYTVCLREALKHRVEVIEIVPGPVATAINTGRDNLGGNQPLEEFIDEVLTQFKEQPTPKEILVSRSAGARFAERDGRFDHYLQVINQGR